MTRRKLRGSCSRDQIQGTFLDFIGKQISKITVNGKAVASGAAEGVSSFHFAGIQVCTSIAHYISEPRLLNW